jgi:alpha-L-rhamnosidase
MHSLCHGSTLFILLIWLIVESQSQSPFDVRIDHHKVDTIRDLIINTPRPRFSWKIHLLNNKSERNVQQTAYQMQLHSIKISQRDISFEWDSERVLSSQSNHVPYTGENGLSPSTYYRFRVRVWTTNSDTASEWTDWIRFRTPIFNLHQYLTNNANAVWIGSTQINMNELRKEFTVPNTSPIVSAIVYLTGIGYYELYVNGERVDPSRKLDPGWTDYEIRTLMVSFDLTANITVRDIFLFSRKIFYSFLFRLVQML